MPLPRLAATCIPAALVLAMAAPATAQTTVISGSIGGAAIESEFQKGTEGQLNIVLQDLGQEVDSNSQFTLAVNGGSQSLVEYGSMRLQAGLSLNYFVNDGSPSSQSWGALHSANGEFRDEITLTWDEGFDPSQPIPVRIYRKAIIPGGGDTASTPLSGFDVGSQFRGRVLSGLISGSSFNQLGYNVNESNYQSAPPVLFADVVVANGALIELYSAVAAKADVAVSWNPDNPAQNVPESRSGLIFFGSMWLEVPEGVVLEGGAPIDWSFEPPAPACLADLNIDGVVNFPDLVQVLANFDVDFGADATGDGLTNFDDLLAVLSAFGDADCG